MSSYERYVVDLDGTPVSAPNLRRLEALAVAQAWLGSLATRPRTTVAIHEETTGELRVGWHREASGWRIVEAVPAWLR
jgi:hypothetical protein